MKTILAAMALSTFALSASAEGLMVHDPYARAAHPTAPSGAAFMEIMNHGETDDTLIEARADVARRIELHTHMKGDDGVMKMMQVEGGIPVPAGETVMLERGGLHVMMMGLNQPFNTGESFPLTLVFGSGEELVVEVPIDLDREPAEGDHADHSDHGSHDH